MKKRRQRTIGNDRRMVMLGIGQGVLGTLLVSHYQLQVPKATIIADFLDNNQFDQRLVQAPRGRILDHKGQIASRKFRSI